MSWMDDSPRHVREPSHYKTAQMCLNGHTITDRVEDSPARASRFCGTCGAETITQCGECGSPIRGHYFVSGLITTRPFIPPKHCHNCGKPFPWTEKTMSAARELADESDELSLEEKTQLKSAIEDLSIDSPRTQVASVRYRKLIAKVGPAVAKGMNELIVSLATEAAKKALGF